MLGDIFVHFEHRDFIDAEDSLELGVCEDSALVRLVLKLVLLDVIQTFLTTSVRGMGAAPTTAASSFEGVNGLEKALVAAPSAFGLVAVFAAAFAGASFAAALAVGFLPASLIRFPPTFPVAH